MKRYIVDANALLSFVTDRDINQQHKVADIFHRAAQLQVVILCPQNVISEFVYVLEKIYKTSKHEIATLIEDLIILPGISIVDDLDMFAVLSYWPEIISDFGDAVIASVAKKNKHAVIFTFDKNLTKKLISIGIDVAV